LKGMASVTDRRDGAVFILFSGLLCLFV
jgi:hypothetical protein